MSERRKLANIRIEIRVLLTFRSLGKRQLLAAGHARSRQKPPLSADMFRNETKIDSCTLAGPLYCLENILGRTEISSDILIIIFEIFPEYIQALTHYI